MRLSLRTASAISALMFAGLAMAGKADQANTANALEVSGAYVRATLPGQTTTSAFVTLKNTTDKKLVLSDIHSKVARTIQLHSHAMVSGQMQMRKIENFSIEPKATAVFKPGEQHIMLIGVEKPLLENTTISVEMCFDDLCSIIKMPVISVLNEAEQAPKTSTSATSASSHQHQH
jgi:copper(I)-binding protein